MTRDFPTVPRSLTIQELAAEELLHTRSSWFMVTDGQGPEGLLTLRQIREVPRGKWAITTLGQAMIPIAELMTANPGEDAASVLERMSEDNATLVAVVDGGRVLGVIFLDDLMQFATRVHSLRA